jgi:sigma-B regulation protein RsbU (phosphoserine phosphatase)
MDSDVRAVGELQRSLLPLPLPTIPGLEVAASYQPCGCAGGDLYDLFPLDGATPPERWCLFIGDATGHGLAAAMVISMLHSILRAHPTSITGPAELLAHSNRHLCHKQIRSFVTAFIGVYEPSTTRLAYSCAGHPPPLVKTPLNTAVCRLDDASSYPLGIDARNTFSEAAIHIGPGNAILLYTDGITEARDPRDEMFSEERLQLAFAACPDIPTRLIERLEERILAHRQLRPPTDDQTLVAIAGATAT